MINEIELYDYLVAEALPNITIYSLKPHEDINDDGNYLFINRVSDDTSTRGLQGRYFGRARFSFAIVCKKELLPTENSVTILNGYISELIGIFDAGCVGRYNAEYAGASSILLNDKDRPMIFTDFIFIYSA